MLPVPASTPKRRTLRYSLSHPRRIGFRDVLLSQARITNLGFALLASLTIISLSYNFNHWIALSPSGKVPNSIRSTFIRPKYISGLDHLIIVPGHAIWNGASAESRLDEDMWILEPYQRNGGRVEAFYKHIEQAFVWLIFSSHHILLANINLRVTLSSQDEKSLVVFSG